MSVDKAVDEKICRVHATEREDVLTDVVNVGYVPNPGVMFGLTSAEILLASKELQEPCGVVRGNIQRECSMQHWAIVACVEDNVECDVAGDESTESLHAVAEAIGIGDVVFLISTDQDLEVSDHDGSQRSSSLRQRDKIMQCHELAQLKDKIIMMNKAQHEHVEVDVTKDEGE